MSLPEFTPVVVVFGCHHHNVAMTSQVTHSPQSGPFWATTTASVHDSL